MTMVMAANMGIKPLALTRVVDAAATTTTTAATKATTPASTSLPHALHALQQWLHGPVHSAADAAYLRDLLRPWLEDHDRDLTPARRQLALSLLVHGFQDRLFSVSLMAVLQDTVARLPLGGLAGAAPVDDADGTPALHPYSPLWRVLHGAPRCGTPGGPALHPVVAQFHACLQGHAVSRHWWPQLQRLTQVVLTQDATIPALAPLLRLLCSGGGNTLQRLVEEVHASTQQAGERHPLGTPPAPRCWSRASVFFLTQLLLEHDDRSAAWVYDALLLPALLGRPAQPLLQETEAGVLAALLKQPGQPSHGCRGMTPAQSAAWSAAFHQAWREAHAALRHGSSMEAVLARSTNVWALTLPRHVQGMRAWFDSLLYGPAVVTRQDLAYWQRSLVAWPRDLNRRFTQQLLCALADHDPHHPQARSDTAVLGLFSRLHLWGLLHLEADAVAPVMTHSGAMRDVCERLLARLFPAPAPPVAAAAGRQLPTPPLHRTVPGILLLRSGLLAHVTRHLPDVVPLHAAYTVLGTLHRLPDAVAHRLAPPLYEALCPRLLAPGRQLTARDVRLFNLLGCRAPCTEGLRYMTPQQAAAFQRAYCTALVEQLGLPAAVGGDPLLFVEAVSGQQVELGKRPPRSVEAWTVPSAASASTWSHDSREMQEEGVLQELESRAGSPRPYWLCITHRHGKIIAASAAAIQGSCRNLPKTPPGLPSGEECVQPPSPSSSTASCSSSRRKRGSPGAARGEDPLREEDAAPRIRRRIPGEGGSA